MRRREQRPKSWKVLARNYISEFGESTSLHGFRYILSSKLDLHPAERIFWLMMVCMSTFGASYLILRNYNRYVADPTVVYIEKNFRDWNIPFPASTVCFLDRLNKTFAEEYIMERWKAEPNTSEYSTYQKFLSSVVNLTYENMNEFEKYLGNEELMAVKGEEMAGIARKVMIGLEDAGISIFDPAYTKHTAFYETLTEMGICFTYGGLVANRISLVNNPPVDESSLPTCNYLNSLCYAKVDNLPTPVKFYIHSSTEIPDSFEKYYLVVRNMELDTTFSFQETVASREQLQRLDPDQRRCRYYDEPENKVYSVYSYNLCRMNCRKKMALEYCGCLPYFYLKEEGVSVCGVKGLACLANYSHLIVRLKDSNGNKAKCKCLDQCESIDYLLEKETTREWSYPVPCNIQYRWAIDNYSTTRQRRRIIFGFEDLLVSLGGTAALFLGCSIISFVEIFYFLTLRLFWYLKNNR